MTEIGYRAAALAARRLPGWIGDPLAAWCADVYVATHPLRARAVDRRLARLWKDAGLGDAPPDARATYRAFARALRDFLALSGGGPPRRDPVVRLDSEAARHLAAARAAGLSTLVVSGHFGPWETALQWLAREVGPVDAIAAPHRAPSVERFFRAHRAAFGIRTLSTGHPAAAALARLREGGWIAVLADRAWRDGDGRAALGAGMVSIDPAPLFLARRARAQVLAGVAWRESDGAVAVRFHPPFILGAGRGNVEIAEARSAIEGFFDAHVRAHPTQWFDWGTGATADTAP